MTDEIQIFAQRAIPTILAALIVAGVLGSIGAWNNSRENSIRIENAMVAMGVLSTNQSEIARNLNETSKQLSVINIRLSTNEKECLQVRQEMERIRR